MINASSKINNTSSVFLILTVILNHIVLNLPKNIISLTGSSSIINIMYFTLLAIGFICIISKLLKPFPRQDILDISYNLGGSFLKKIIGVIFIIYFIFTAGLFLRLFCENLKIIYFANTPIMYLLLIFLIGVFFCNRLSFSAICKANLFVVPSILLSIIFIFVATSNNFNIQNIFPILGNGFDVTFVTGLSNITAFCGLSFLYFLPPSLRDDKNFKNIGICTILISSFLLICSISTLIFTTPWNVANDEILPLFLASRTIEFGRFFQRLDAIFLLIWIISMISYLSILANFCLTIFQKITKFKFNNLMSLSLIALILLAGILPKSYIDVNFLETFVFKVLTIFIVFILSFFILFLNYLKNAKKVKRKVVEEK